VAAATSATVAQLHVPIPGGFGRTAQPPRVGGLDATHQRGADPQPGIPSRCLVSKPAGAVSDHAPLSFGIVVAVLKVVEDALAGRELAGQVQPSGLARLLDGASRFIRSAVNQATRSALSHSASCAETTRGRGCEEAGGK
jgi:hypothetical protein